MECVFDYLKLAILELLRSSPRFPTTQRLPMPVDFT
jgi:hypothetical protein